MIRQPTKSEIKIFFAIDLDHDSGVKSGASHIQTLEYVLEAIDNHDRITYIRIRKRRQTMTRKAHIPAEIKAHVMTAYACCVACGTWEADECGHIVAESKGGEMVKENFVRLCGFCNRKQGTATVAFKMFAQPSSDSMTLGEHKARVTTNRAYWSRYCGVAKSSKIKVKPYTPSV